MIQAAFASLGDGQDRPIGNDSDIYWNMYTAPAWLAVLLSLINIVVLMPFVFTEFYIAKEEGDYLAARGLKKSSPDQEEEEIVTKMKPDKVALVVCIVITATTQFNFNFIERYFINWIFGEMFEILLSAFRLLQHGDVGGD